MMRGEIGEDSMGGEEKGTERRQWGDSIDGLDGVEGECT